MITSICYDRLKWNFFKIENEQNWNLTKVVLVNWFVAWVICAKDDACSLILFDVVIARFVVNLIKYSRTLAWEFNSALYSSNADWFNGING